MNTIEKTTRAAAIICHINAICAETPRPLINPTYLTQDLAEMSGKNLLDELEAILAELHPGDAGCLSLVGDFRARLFYLAEF